MKKNLNGRMLIMWAAGTGILFSLIANVILVVFPDALAALIAFVKIHMAHRELYVDNKWPQMVTAMARVSLGLFCGIFAIAAAAQYWKFTEKNRSFVIITETEPFLLVSFAFCLFAVKTGFLACNIVRHDGWVLAAALTGHLLLFCGVFRNRTGKELAIALAVCYGLIALSLAMSSVFYASGFDTEHGYVPVMLDFQAGWNPLYAPYESDFVGMAVHYKVSYPKFVYLFGAVFNGIFGSIEFGKAYHGIFYAAAVLYTLRMASRFHTSTAVILFITAFIAANPCSFALWEYSVDDIAGCCMLMLIFSLLDYEWKQETRCILMVVFLSVISINLKLSGAVCGLALIAFIIKWLVQRQVKPALVMTIAGAVILITGFCIMGYNPYITNYLKYGSPLYPFYGKGAQEVWMSGEYAAYFPGQNAVQRFLSLFWIDAADWKNIPFFPLKLKNLGKNIYIGRHVAGFGIFLLEIFILSAAAYRIVLKKEGNAAGKTLKNEKPLKDFLFASLLVSGISIVFPENWMARYVPFLWYVPALLLLPVRFEKFFASKVIVCVLAFYIFIDSGLMLTGTLARNMLATGNTKLAAREMSAAAGDRIDVIMLDHETEIERTVRERLGRLVKGKTLRFIRVREQANERYPETWILDWKEGKQP